MYLESLVVGVLATDQQEEEEEEEIVWDYSSANYYMPQFLRVNGINKQFVGFKYVGKGTHKL